MNEKQKKIIWKTAFILIFLTSLALFIVGLISTTTDKLLDSKVGIIVTSITSLISPSMLFGVGIKMGINKLHQKAMQAIVGGFEEQQNIIKEQNKIAKSVLPKTPEQSVIAKSNRATIYKVQKNKKTYITIELNDADNHLTDTEIWDEIDKLSSDFGR